MGIDATRKWLAEGYTGQWPTRLQTSPAASAKAEAIWKTLAGKTAK
jgi:4-hydroxy-3-polyprenylbenzoate decarboxylase